jgi:LPXTG-site transpeptidase (sortase) family protein
MSLAPLITPQAVHAQDALVEETVSADLPEAPQVDVAATPIPELESQAVEAALSVPLTVEDGDQASAFASPVELANALLLQGITDRMVIPKLNLAAPIVDSPIENETWKVDHLGQSVGHLAGTALPGSSSNVVYAAHVTVSRDEIGPFINLSQLAPGDVIYVYQGEKEFQYVVDDFQTVDRTAIEVTHSSDIGQITLITCSNWDEAAGRYANRLIVKGRLTEG